MAVLGTRPADFLSAAALVFVGTPLSPRSAAKSPREFNRFEIRLCDSRMVPGHVEQGPAELYILCSVVITGVGNSTGIVVGFL